MSSTKSDDLDLLLSKILNKHFKKNLLTHSELHKKQNEIISEILHEIKENPKISTMLNRNVKSNLEQNVKKTLMKKFDDLKNMTKVSKSYLQYEAYKILNPKQIAGETLVQNYLGNYITGGIKKATKYEKRNESKKIPPKYIKSLETKGSSLLKKI